MRRAQPSAPGHESLRPLPVCRRSSAGIVTGMAKADDPRARTTTAQRAQQRRDQKLAEVQEEIDSGRMTHRRLTPEEMEEHAGRREELQAQRRNRKS
jgi:hypothetical protein